MNAVVLAIGWQVYDLARRTMGIESAALGLGLIGLLQFAPVVLLTPVSGLVADRVDRRLASSLSLAVQLTGALFLAALAFSHAMSLLALYTVAFALGVFRVFYMPAMNALAPNLVPPQALQSAVAVNAIAGRTGAVLGPVLGGAFYARGPGFAFLLAAVLLCFAIGGLATIRWSGHPSVDRPPARPGHIWEGLGYVRRHRLLLGAISLDLFAVLFGGATAMLPAYARDILAVGPQGLGLLRASPAIGALASALWFAWRPTTRRGGGLMLGACSVFGFATIAFGLSRSFALSMACLMLIGAADMVSVVIRQSLVQLQTPDAMRGRVGAISTLFISASNELGEAESGFMAAVMGLVPSVVFGGAGAVLVTALWSRLFPELRKGPTPPSAA